MRPALSKSPRKSILRARQPRTITPLSVELSQRIPPEVIDIIIESLVHFDLSTLAICTLVCKSWLAASRYRLFPTISLHPWNVKGFLQLLDSPHSTISRGVRRVSIQHDSEAISQQVSPSRAQKPCKSDHAAEDYRVDAELLRRLSTFASLGSLCFSWVEDGMKCGVTAPILLHGFPNLTDLEFRTCTFPSFHEFTDVVCSLLNLRRISLSDLKWLDTDMPPSLSTQIIPPLLHTLELYTAPVSHFCHWFASHSKRLHSLETVKLCSAFWREADAVSIGWMLHRLGRRVKHLSLPWHLPEVNFRHHTELQSLHITHLRLQPDSMAEECITAVGLEETLLQLASPELVTVECNVMVPHGVDPFGLWLDWDKLGKILARPDFAQLRVVKFGIPFYDRKLAALLRKARKPTPTKGDVLDALKPRQRSRYDKF